ncbi:sigma factor-like helix-turn-helix DNA-binding protein, partial [Dokdonella sp.]|uniref:sigma factor-like helix-turn-helix DNA-binding protein n=1 Tax=Dokdonella sp. TaxID=2291710 RepID=UPI003C5746E3
AQVLKANREMTARLGRAPTLDELADAVGKQARDVAELFRVNEHISSLDAPMSEGDDRSMIEQLVEEEEFGAGNQPDPAGSGQLQGWLEALIPRQRTVVERRFGLNGEPVHSRADIAEDFGVSRERVRQIQEEALKRLRQISKRDQAS